VDTWDRYSPAHPSGVSAHKLPLARDRVCQDLSSPGHATETARQSSVPVIRSASVGLVARIEFGESRFVTSALVEYRTRTFREEYVHNALIGFLGPVE